MSAVAFFRLKCDGDCGRWLSDITGNNVPRLTTMRGRALTFATGEEALKASVQVGWTKGQEELIQNRSLCGNCRARKEREQRD